MSQKTIKKARKEYKRLFDSMMANINEEPFRQRLKMAWSIIAKKNLFINKNNRSTK